MEHGRREFLRDLAGAGAAVALAGCASKAVPGGAYATRAATPRFMWAFLAHFGMKPWYYRTQEDKREKILKSIDIVGEIAGQAK